MLNLSKNLYNINSIKFGDFQLKSGKRSPFYLDLRQIVSHPFLLEEIANLISTKVDSEIKRICGVPYAALPLATVVSLKSNKPLLIKRKEAKGWGTKKLIEGEFSIGDECFLIEDVITSGESLIETIQQLETEGLKIRKIITIVDRQQGGSDKLKQLGYDIESLMTITNLLDNLNELGLIDTDKFSEVNNYLNHKEEKHIKKLPKLHPHPKAQKLLQYAWDKKSNIIASVDLTIKDDILNFVDLIGDKICGVKLHVDIIEDFDFDFIDKLKFLSEEKKFIIIEDRKFADIGNTQMLQLQKGIYRISSWADFITLHLIAGESVLKTIKDSDLQNNLGLIPIVEMSSNGSLTDKDYIEKCNQFIYKYSNVVGVVGQKLKVDSPLLKFTPGVNLNEKCDDRGQQYNDPQWVIENLKSDFIIVGRGIYQSDNPVMELDKYLEVISQTTLFD